MKLHFTFLLMIFGASILNAQMVVDFEAYDLESESFLNGADGSGGFTSGDIFLPNDYNADFMSWSGWAISNTTDTTTPGFTNQYSAIPGSGVDGSAHYAVTSAFGNNNLVLQGDAAGQPVSGMYITNNTYAYLSIKDGDSFAKKFGGVTGDDPDFYLLTIKAYNEGSLSVDSVDFYLADYRFSDNSEDYIVDEWTWVDLSSLGNADSLSFALSSSDVGQFGMNTPAYFCIDDVFSADPGVNTDLVNDPELFEIYPNPTADYLQITHSENQQMDCYIYDINGKVVKSQQLNGPEIIDLQFLPTGTYIIMVQGEHQFSSRVIEKI